MILLSLLFRFVQYKPTSLEKNYKHELLTDVDLGVNIDLIDPDTYAISQDGMKIVATKVLGNETTIKEYKMYFECYLDRNLQLKFT